LNAFLLRNFNILLLIQRKKLWPAGLPDEGHRTVLD
jgi:hypothetical protein